MIWINAIFILTLVALAFIPKKGRIFKIWLIIFFMNIGVRCYLIYENDIKSKNIADLEQKLIDEKETIRSFDSSIELALQGRWEEGSSPDKLKRISPTDDEYYLVLETLSQDSSEKIKFYSTEIYTYTLEENNKVVFRSRQSVKSGFFPCGGKKQELKPYKKMTVWIPRVRQKYLIDGNLILIGAKINFFINGELFHALKYDKASKISFFDQDYAGFSIVRHNIFENKEQIN